MTKYILSALLVCVLSLLGASHLSSAVCLGVLVGDALALVGFIFAIAT